MTCLMEVITGPGRCSRQFRNVLNKPKPGDCLRLSGFTVRVVEVVECTDVPADPSWEELDLPPELEFRAVIICVPLELPEMVGGVAK